MLNIGVLGSTGRIGSLIIDALSNEVNDKSICLSCIYARGDIKKLLPDNIVITNDITTLLESSDVVIDFSSADATSMLLDIAVKACPKPIVIGTTGLNKAQNEQMLSASKLMPILYSSNMSRGISLLKKLVSIASSTLNNSDIEIVEVHHRNKVDSPSGTALSLAKVCADSRNIDLDNVKVTSRDGIVGKRKDDEIAIMAIRGGDVAGKHTIGFYLDGEYLELTHTATNRMTFANGAITAAKWLATQSAGFYSLEDSL